jgi:hypothetical protein
MGVSGYNSSSTLMTLAARWVRVIEQTEGLKPASFSYAQLHSLDWRNRDFQKFPTMAISFLFKTAGRPVSSLS